MDKNLKKYFFHVHGMHCAACVMNIEDTLLSLPSVKYAKTSLKNHSLEVRGEFGDASMENIAEVITLAIKSGGYTVSVEKQVFNKKWGDFKYAIPIALIFLVLFVVLQKTGLVSIIGKGKVNYGTAFIIGIVASLSTCMAVVGGLLLSMSATFAKEGNKIKPQVMFHLGRIVSFFILGGVIGALGAKFTLGTNSSFAIGIFVGIVMLIMGINLLDIFPWAKGLQISMPKFISKNAHNVANINSTITPLLVGVATFFLPCGFTQSMQIFTLSTGSFINGGLTMLSFALGTLPVLSLVSFSSFSISGSKSEGVFFKTAGLIVIMFAIFNIINSLVVIGIMPAVFNF